MVFRYKPLFAYFQLTVIYQLDFWIVYNDDQSYCFHYRIGASGLLTDIERQLFHHVTGRYSAAHELSMS